MYEAAKNLILHGIYDLGDLLYRLHKVYMDGYLTEEQLDELVQLARDNADPAAANNLLGRIEDHEDRIRKLEEGDGVAPPSEEYPEWKPNHPYRKGEKVTFKGKKYVCVLNEHTDSTLFSPEAYPVYWQLVP